MALHTALVRSYVRVVFHPSEFFRETPSPTAIEGGIAVFFVGVVTALASLAIAAILADLFTVQGYPNAASAVWSVIGRFVVYGFLGVFVLWIVAAAVMHFVATTSPGGGSMGETLGVTGYGMLPSVLQTVLGIGFAYLAVQGVHLSGGPEAVATQLQRVFQRQGLLQGLLDWGFIAWQATIWMFGLERVHDIPRGKAVLAAGIVGLGLGLLG